MIQFRPACFAAYKASKWAEEKYLLESKRDLYLKLFNDLRDLSNEVIDIKNLIANAQIYGSDEVLKLLELLKPDSGISDGDRSQALHFLLVQMRKEITPGSKPEPPRVL